ncbi:MAG: phosphate signaling complex protein PhoU, partial [Planctomycetes bacterium]|nr:phosphate signaling complex protein PhoU [Planctomycetota bacterium]
LDELKKQLLAVGGLVEVAIHKATVAVFERKLDLAEEVLAGDREIDEREVAIEEEYLKVLALQQPVATDLRFIVAALKVNNDLERMGDLAVNIAERAVMLAKLPPAPMPTGIRSMVTKVEEMVRDSLGALVAVDVDKARRVLIADDEVDEIHRRTFDEMQTLMRQHSDQVERATAVITISRNLERIGDQATNIAEDVIFMVEGEIVRHGGF